MPSGVLRLLKAEERRLSRRLQSAIDPEQQFRLARAAAV